MARQTPRSQSPRKGAFVPLLETPWAPKTDLWAKPPPKRKAVPSGHSSAPSRSEVKRFVVHQAENLLTPAELHPPPKKKPVAIVPYRSGYVPPKLREPEKKSIDKRYQAAIASTVSDKARSDLAKGVSPGRRKELLKANEARRSAYEQTFKQTPRLPPTLPPSVPDPWIAHLGHPVRTSLQTGRRVVGAGRALVGDVEAGAIVAGKPLAKLALGGALAVSQALHSVRSASEGNWQQDAAPSPIEKRLQTEGVPLPSGGQLLNVGMGLGKVAAGAPGVVAGIPAHPLRFAKDAISMARAAGMAPVAITAILLNPKYSIADRQRMAEAAIQATWDDVVAKYGPDVTWKQAVRNGYEHSFIHLMDIAAVAFPTAKGAMLVRGMKAGLKFREAQALMHDPTRFDEFSRLHPGLKEPKGRSVTIRDPYAESRTVELPQARDPGVRAVQRGYDVATRGLEKVVGEGRAAKVPTTPTRRGLRRELVLEKRKVARLKAEGAVLWNEVAHYVGTDTAKGERLFHMMEKPADVPDEVWLRGLLQDTQRMLDEVPSTDRKPSAKEVQLSKKVERFRAQMEQAGRDRWLTRIADVHHEQQRMHASILADEDNLRQLRQLQREIQADDTLDPGAKGRRLENIRLDVRHLEQQRKAIKEQLAEITVEQLPVDSEPRTQLASTLEQLPNVSDEQAQALLGIVDSHNRQWLDDHRQRLEKQKAQNLKQIDLLEKEGASPQRIDTLRQLDAKLADEIEQIKPGDFYSHPTGFNLRDIQLVEHHTDIPEGSLAQRMTRLEQPGDFNAERDLGLVLDQFAPRRGVKPLAGLPGNIKGRRSLARLVNTMAGRLEEGVGHAKDWYRNSGREILAATGGDVDRADQIAQIVAIYSPQKAVAPNIAEALRVIHDWENDVAAGRHPEVRVGNADQRERAGQALRGEDWLSKLGPEQVPKVRRFYANLLKNIDPSRLAAHGFTGDEVTVDGWMGGAFGFGYNTASSAMTAAQFNFAEKVVQELAKHYGLEPEEAQAAIWTSVKAERDVTTKRMYRNPKTREEALKRSGQSFAEAMFSPENTLRIPFESMTSLRPELARLSPEHQAGVTAELGNSILRNFQQEGFIARRESTGFGFWRDPDTGLVERNPQGAMQIALGNRPVTVQVERTAEEIAAAETRAAAKAAKTGKPAKPVSTERSETRRDLYLQIPEETRRLADGVTATIGEALEQGRQGWARFLSTRDGPELEKGEVGNVRDHTAFRADFGRELTDEEMGRIVESLPDSMYASHTDNGVIIAHVDPDSILDRSIRVEQRGRVSGVPAERQARARQVQKGATATGLERRAQVMEALDAATMGAHPDVKITVAAHRGALHDADTFHVLRAESGRSDALERILGSVRTEREAIFDRYLSDPEAALASHTAREAEAALSEGVAPARGPPVERARIERMNQTRKTDILGAVQFLNTPEGGRILYLTRQADVSTLLHELYGHGVNEISKGYPEQWARVEDFMGKPLADWLVEDHERFARMAERYFTEGRAPAPELVPTFAHMKAWMRAIYGAEQKIVKDMSPAVRDLFDEMFGSYNDDNVYRVAQMIGHVPQEGGASRARGAWMFNAQELAALRRRNDTRAFNRSLEGLTKRLDDQNQALIEEYGTWDNAPEADKEAIRASHAQLAIAKAARDVSEFDRKTGLRRRIDSLEQALANPDDPGYEGALAALQGLQDSREEILRSVFGDQYEETFTNRVDLLADHLAEQGLIPSDFERGTARYVRHAALGEDRTRVLDRPATGLTTSVIGPADPRYLNLHHRNELIRWKNGDLNADPKVVLEAWQNAQAFAFVHGLKGKLREAGRRLDPNEPIPNDAYVILDGTPLPWLQKATMKPGSTADAQRVMDALEGRDPRALEESLTDYIGNFVQDGEQLNKDLAAAARDDPAGAHSTRQQLNAWIVSKAQVDQLFRPIRGSRTQGLGKAWDMANTIARWSMIYTNPAYIPINFIGNSFFLLAEQGPLAVANLQRAAKIGWQDKELRDLIAVNTGEVPAIAAISRGRRVGKVGAVQERAGGAALKVAEGAERAGKVIPFPGATRTGRWIGDQAREAERVGWEEQALRTVTAAPDKYPRIAAWIYHARKKGYKTPAQMKELLRSDTPKAARDREIIQDKASEIMVNFDRLSETERLYVTRFLFVWPWIRGATAWPFHYAREYPLRTAIAANVGATTEEYRQQQMGDVPLGYKDLFPVSVNKRNNTASVINVNQFSPTSTAAQSLEGLVGNVESIFTNAPLETGTALSDYVQPIIQAGMQLATGRDDFGREVGHRDALLDNVFNFVPWGTTIRQLVDPTKASKTYTRRGAKSVLERKYARFLPQDVSLSKLHQYQNQHKQKTTLEKVNDKVDGLHKSLKDAGIKDPLPVPRSVRHAIVIQQSYEDMRDKLKQDIKDSGWYPKKDTQTEPKLTGRQEAGLVYALYQRYAPEMAKGLIPPDELEKGGYDLYVQALIYGNKELGVPGILEPLESYRSEISKAKREAKGG